MCGRWVSMRGFRQVAFCSEHSSPRAGKAGWAEFPLDLRWDPVKSLVDDHVYFDNIHAEAMNCAPGNQTPS